MSDRHHIQCTSVHVNKDTEQCAGQCNDRRGSYIACSYICTFLQHTTAGHCIFITAHTLHVRYVHVLSEYVE